MKSNTLKSFNLGSIRTNCVTPAIVYCSALFMLLLFIFPCNYCKVNMFPCNKHLWYWKQFSSSALTDSHKTDLPLVPLKLYVLHIGNQNSNFGRMMSNFRGLAVLALSKKCPSLPQNVLFFFHSINLMCEYVVVPLPLWKKKPALNLYHTSALF